METGKQKRKKYLIDKSFQFKFVAVIVFLQICAAVLVGFIMSYLYLFVFNDGKIACQHNYILFFQWGIVLGILSIVLMIWGVIYTHRIIGPVYRTRILLRDAALGNIPAGKIKFRKNDKFKNLAEDLTNCFEIMKKYRQEMCEHSKNTE